MPAALAARRRGCLCLPEQRDDPLGTCFLHVERHGAVAAGVEDAVVVDAGGPHGHGIVPLGDERVDAADEPATFAVDLEVADLDGVQLQLGVDAAGTVECALDAEVGALYREAVIIEAQGFLPWVAKHQTESYPNGVVNLHRRTRKYGLEWDKRYVWD